jgi:hypothetical protein
VSPFPGANRAAACARDDRSDAAFAQPFSQLRAVINFAGQEPFRRLTAANRRLGHRLAIEGEALRLSRVTLPQRLAEGLMERHVQTSRGGVTFGHGTVARPPDRDHLHHRDLVAWPCLGHGDA